MEHLAMFRLYEVLVGLFIAFCGWLMFCKHHTKVGNSLLMLSLLWLSALALTPWGTAYEPMTPNPVLPNEITAPISRHVSTNPSLQQVKVGSVYLSLDELGANQADERISNPSREAAPSHFQPASFVFGR